MCIQDRDGEDGKLVELEQLVVSVTKTVAKTVVEELGNAEDACKDACKDLPMFKTALAVKAVLGAVVDGVEEVCEVPFVKVALGIVIVLRAHVQTVRKADKYVVEAGKRAKAMQDTINKLAKAGFDPQRHQSFANILDDLTELMKVGLSSG